MNSCCSRLIVLLVSKPITLRAAFLGLSAALVLAAAGCSNNKPTAATLEAVRHLQQNEPQKAVDVLANDTSARANYLRAVAFERQKKAEQAAEQMAVALTEEPENVDYHGYDLRLQLRQGKGSAADQLIALREANRTSAALALFAFYAYAGKAKGLNQKGAKKEAYGSSQEAMRSLQTSIALSAHIPEFQRELLELSLAAGLREGADILTEKLLAAAPDDPDVARERVYALLHVNKPDDAAETAQTLYEKSNKDEEVAVLYARALQRARVNASHDEQFRQLADTHPKNIPVISGYALYLTRAKRFQQSEETLDAALERHTEPAARRQLIDVSIGLPLEIGDVDKAQAKLDQRREELADPIVLAYYEGRIAFLHRDHATALEKLALVIKSQKEATATNRRLGAEALQWTRIVLRDFETREKLDRAVNAVTSPGEAEAEAEKPDESADTPGRQNGTPGK